MSDPEQEEEKDEDPTSLTKVLCHQTGFIVGSGNGQAFINCYEVSREPMSAGRGQAQDPFEIRLIESYLCSSNNQVPHEVTCLQLSYDKNYVVFAAKFKDEFSIPHLQAELLMTQQNVAKDEFTEPQQ